MVEIVYSYLLSDCVRDEVLFLSPSHYTFLIAGPGYVQSQASELCSLTPIVL